MVTAVGESKSVTWNNQWFFNFAISEVALRVLRTYMPLVGEFALTAWNFLREFYHYCRVFILETTVHGLQTKLNQMSLLVHQLSIGSEGLMLENKQLRDERDDVIKQREETVSSRAPILIERDHLLEENKELRQKLETLTNVAQQKNEIEEKYAQTLNDLGIAQQQLKRAKQNAEFSAQVNELFRQMQDVPVSGSVQIALTTYPQIAKSHKDKFHNTLREQIAKMEPLDPATVCLAGILRVSEEEVNHLEWMSKIFQLLETLQQPLNAYVQENSILVGG
jgi:hypothetical protein